MSTLSYSPFKSTFGPSYKTCNFCYKRCGMYEYHDCQNNKDIYCKICGEKETLLEHEIQYELLKHMENFDKDTSCKGCGYPKHNHNQFGHPFMLGSSKCTNNKCPKFYYKMYGGNPVKSKDNGYTVMEAQEKGIKCADKSQNNDTCDTKNLKSTYVPSYRTCDKCNKILFTHGYHNCQKCIDCGYTIMEAHKKGVRCLHRFTYKTQENLSQNNDVWDTKNRFLRPSSVINDSQPKTKYMYSCYPQYGLLPPPFNM
jgi:hypothetical protein